MSAMHFPTRSLPAAWVALAALAGCSPAGDTPGGSPGPVAEDPTSEPGDPGGPGAVADPPGAPIPARSVRNAVVIVADTLRRDRMSAYGAERATTPLLDARADRVVRMESVFATSNWTHPTTASLLTGAILERHGIDWEVNVGELPPIDEMTLLVPSLVPRLGDAGWRTGFFSGNAGLSVVRGLDEGFDAFEFPVEEGVANSQQVVDEALAWLDGGSVDQPFFLYLQPFDTHFPYSPPEAVAGTFRDPATLPFDSTPAGQEAAIAAYPSLDEEGQAEVRQALLDLYDEELLFLDRQVDRLLGQLEARGLLDDTLVVWTADHGELFDDGGTTFFYHGVSLRPGVNRVPLLFYGPGLEGAVSRDLVSTVDVMPTVLHALGVEDVQAPDGLVIGASPLRTRAWAWDSVGAGWGDEVPPMAALTDGRLKVQVECESAAELAFDLEADPEEVAGFDPDDAPDAAALRDEILLTLDALRPGECLPLEAR